ncbi:hypothetical protein [Sulfuracidifex tepidarius]|uniref:ATPase n=1 Tax=Sulfuracidifex tepidarius TaxID=1294262 RepID=A0A510E7A9_9CREN|nr:hypothetical protein [Sulfuracidifex tepidarius]BBG28148.1 hypothetical protein IC007_2703 [Sulfuracidifex tepidarius]
MIKILVSGVVPFDSGKTTFSLRLMDLIKEIVGEKTVFPFKPVAGHNLWYSEHTIDESLKHGLLLGNDALKYLQKSNLNPRYINPVAAASVPVDLDKLSFDFTEYERYMFEGSFVLMRETTIQGKEIHDNYFVNRKILNMSVQSLSKKMSKMIDLFMPVSVDDITSRILNAHERVSEFFKSVANLIQPEVTIIESYNDALSPLSLDSLDLAFIVSPGKAFAVEGERVIHIMRVMNSPPWIVRTGSVLRYLRSHIIKSFELPAEKSVLDLIFH